MANLSDKQLGLQDVNTLTFNDLAATPASPTAGHGKLYRKNDGKLYTLNSAGEEVEVGSGAGSGGVNYVTNGDFNTNVSGWSVTSGAGSLSHETASPIEGDGSLKFVSNGSPSTITGTIDTIPSIDLGVLLGVEMVIDVTDASGSYATGDFTVEIHDGTAAVGEVASLKAGRNRITTNELGFVAETGTTYTIKINDVTANASPSADYFILDRVKVTSDRSPAGAVITDMPNFTVSIDNAPNITTSRGRGQRIGDRLHLDVVVEGAAGNTASPATWNWPYSDITPVIADGEEVELGETANIGSNESYTMLGVWDSSNSEFALYYKLNLATSTAVFNGSGFSSGRQWQFKTSFDITEWSGAGTVNLMDRGITTSNARMRRISNNEGVANNGTLAFATADYLEGGGSFSAGVYTVPATGYYRMSISLRFTASALQHFSFAKNGTVFGQAGVNLSEYLSGSETVYAEEGDTLSIKNESGATRTTVANTKNALSIERIADHSALAPVGFGVATDTQYGIVKGGEVPGQASSSPIASGYLGETLTETYVGPGGAIVNTTSGITALTLPAGIWTVYASGLFYAGGVVAEAYAVLSTAGYTSTLTNEGVSEKVSTPTGVYSRFNTGPIYVTTDGVTGNLAYVAITSSGGAGTTVSNVTVRAIRIG